MPSRSPFRALILLLATAALHAQTSVAPTGSERPLPDIPTLMRQVETNQRRAESIQKNYIFREDLTFDELNGSGGIKKTDERAFEIFWSEGVRVARLIRKDNKDLPPDQLAKENDRIDKEVAKGKARRAKADAEGKQTDSDGRDEIALSRILELGTFSNPRREFVAGRPTIVVDYTGDPAAKTRNDGEKAFKLLAGTVWIDERDKIIQHLQAHFTENFKVGGGLIVDIRKDTSVQLTNILVNNEVWLPSTLEAHGHARYRVFFSLNGDAHIRSSDYRKFKATSTILPTITVAPPDPPNAPQ